VVSTPRLRSRRWLVGSFVAVSIVLLAAAIVRWVVLRDSTRVVPADEALEDFRAEATSSAASTIEVASTVPPLAEPGIYRYRTTGSEEIDVLGGAMHEYPAETAITLVERRCGVHLRWDALRERREEWALCSTPDGLELQPDGVQYHEFFGQPYEEALSCDLAVLVAPVATSNVEGVQQQSCTLADDPWLPSWEILERATRSIDDTQVGVQHVRMTLDDDDEYWEHLVVDWYLADTGLPIEVRSTKESRSPSPVGPVVYREQYHIELVSTVPLR
jgi:hypothetical protein